MEAKQRQKFWKLHSILGIGIGLPLYIIFLAGTFSLFHPEYNAFLYPDQSRALPDRMAPLNPVFEKMWHEYPEASQISFRIATPDHPVTDMYLSDPRKHFWIDPTDGTVSEAIHHDFGHFLVDLHFLNIFPMGSMVGGLVTVAFVSVIFTGIIYQLRDIATDLKVPKRGLSLKNFNRKWHRFLSLLTIPYQLMYALTGIMLTLGLMAMAPAVHLFFDGDQEELTKGLYPMFYLESPNPDSESLPDVDKILADSNRHWQNKVTPFVLEVNRRGEKGTIVSVEGHDKEPGFLRKRTLGFNPDGTLLTSLAPGSDLGGDIIEGSLNLHFGFFGSFTLKIIYAVLGLGVAFSIAVGLMIWILRDKVEQNRILSAIIISLTLGVYLGIALGFVGIRFLPEHGATIFYIGVALSCILSLFVPPRKSVVIHGWLIGFTWLTVIIAGIYVLGFTFLKFDHTAHMLVLFFHISSLFLALFGFSLLYFSRTPKRHAENK